jgi:hypothetical protein
MMTRSEEGPRRRQNGEGLEINHAHEEQGYCREPKASVEAPTEHMEVKR